MKKKRKKKPVDLEYEESVRVSKIFKNVDKLSKKDPSNLEFREHQILSQKIFDDGNEIEAFIVLHGLIEIHLNRFWQFFMNANGIFDEPRIEPKSRSYADLTELLYEAGLMEQETHQNLTDFNAHRNLLSHNLFGNKKRKTTKQRTKAIFDSGLNASGMLPVLIGRFLHVEGKKNPKFKKTFKKVFGFAF